MMGSELEDLTVVVTGASSGIGAAIARTMAANGRRVITIQRRPPERVGKQGAGSIEFVEADLADPVATREIAEEVAQRYPVGFLVNNAGANRPGGIEIVSDVDLDTVWQLNVKAPIRLIKSVLPQMQERRFGRIVNISSRAILGKTQRIAYASSKAGVVGLTRSLSLEIAPYGVTINSVAPGPVETELFTNGHPIGSEKRSAVIRSIPLQRVGTPEDISHAVAFFLSPESGFITGQTLFVCGGVSISGSGGL